MIPIGEAWSVQDLIDSLRARTGRAVGALYVDLPSRGLGRLSPIDALAAVTRAEETIIARPGEAAAEAAARGDGCGSESSASGVERRLRRLRRRAYEAFGLEPRTGPRAQMCAPQRPAQEAGGAPGRAPQEPQPRAASERGSSSSAGRGSSSSAERGSPSSVKRGSSSSAERGPSLASAAPRPRCPDRGHEEGSGPSEESESAGEAPPRPVCGCACVRACA